MLLVIALVGKPFYIVAGDKVLVGGTKPGRVLFLGETQFASGMWAGVVLDKPLGKNDGSIAGIRYFQVNFFCCL